MNNLETLVLEKRFTTENKENSLAEKPQCKISIQYYMPISYTNHDNKVGHFYVN